MLIALINFFSIWVVPLLIALVLLFALFRRVNVFDAFIEGAAEGFGVAVRLIPFLVGMLVAIGLFRDSGAMDLLVSMLTPFFSLIRVPPEILPLAFMRPISGSCALAMTTEILRAHGPDSFLGRIASTMQGSTDTTLYVLTVYFGAVGIRRVRHALAAGLLADLCGFIAAVAICRIVFG